MENFTANEYYAKLDKMDYLNRGTSKYNAKDYNGAIVDYSMAIEINPKNYLAYFFRGDSKFKLQDYQGSINDFCMVIEINPNHSNSYYARGRSKFKLQDYTGTLSDYRKAKETGITMLMDLLFAETYLLRANARVNQQDYKGAIADYNMVIGIEPTSKFAKAAANYLNELDAITMSSFDLPTAIEEISGMIKDVVDSYTLKYGILEYNSVYDKVYNSKHTKEFIDYFLAHKTLAQSSEYIKSVYNITWFGFAKRREIVIGAIIVLDTLINTFEKNNIELSADDVFKVIKGIRAYDDSTKML